jgi:hypothetical protein
VAGGLEQVVLTDHRRRPKKKLLLGKLKVRLGKTIKKKPTQN